MEYLEKIETYGKLSNTYIDIIEKILDFSIEKKIVPLKIVLSYKILKNYIHSNKQNLVINGIEHLLNYKHDILNFNLNNLDVLDDDLSDNQSRKSYLHNINQVKNKINFDDNNDNNYKENEILNLIIDIKNKAKKLNKMDISIIKGYIELLILILENIKKLFN
jgi:hypothetical protein